MNYKYTEYKPGPNLSEYIDYFWTLRLDEPCNPPNEDIRLPDYCPEWIFSISSGNRHDDHGSSRRVIGSLITTRYKQSGIMSNGEWVDLFAIRFRPFGLAALFNFNMRKLDGYTGLIQPSLLVPGIKKELERLISAAGTFSGMLASTKQFLIRMITKNGSRDKVIRQAVSNISRAHGNILIDKLCHSCNVSRTTLHNKFLDFIGLSPKELARIYRLNHFLNKGLKQQDETFTKLALDCGYYDQSHLNRDFKSLIGTTPTRFFRLSSSVIVRK